MFQAPDSSQPTDAFDPRAIDEASDADLDSLQFGVIGVDREGTILRYNLYESRFARLDRNQVLGRRFFGEVAPCTKNDAFLGRFERFTAPDCELMTDRFPFLFDFKFGAQEVVVEFVRASAPGRYYLLVNRTSARGPRAGIPSTELAVEQRVLAPGEAELGVMRDDVEMRVVRVPWSFLAALRVTCERLAPESWPILCDEWGRQWGRRAAVDLESTALERHAKSLRELTMATVAELVSEQLNSEGWGRATFDFALSNAGLVAIDFERSALAESARMSTRARSTGGVPSSNGFSCHLLAGCLGALLSHVANRKLVVREVQCASVRANALDPHTPVCLFVAVGQRRKIALDAALTAGARDLASVHEALARARDGEP